MAPPSSLEGFSFSAQSLELHSGIASLEPRDAMPSGISDGVRTPVKGIAGPGAPRAGTSINAKSSLHQPHVTGNGGSIDGSAGTPSPHGEGAPWAPSAALPPVISPSSGSVKPRSGRWMPSGSAVGRSQTATGVSPGGVYAGSSGSGRSVPSRLATEVRAAVPTPAVRGAVGAGSGGAGVSSAAGVSGGAGSGGAAGSGAGGSVAMHDTVYPLSVVTSGAGMGLPAGVPAEALAGSAIAAARLGERSAIHGRASPAHHLRPESSGLGPHLSVKQDADRASFVSSRSGGSDVKPLNSLSLTTTSAGPVRGAPPRRGAPLRRRRGRRFLLRCSMDLTSWRNYIQLSITVVELCQLASLALGTDQERASERVRSLLPAGTAEFFSSARALIWEGSAVGLTQAQKVDVAFAAISAFGLTYTLLCGVFIALELTAESWLAPILFTLMAGAAYVSVTSGTLYVMIHSSSGTQVVCALLILLYFSSTAVFVSIYRGDASGPRGVDEARIRPTFLAIERVVKGTLAAAFVSLVGAPVVRALVVAGLLTAYLVFFVASAPCSVVSLNVLRTGGIAASWWCAVISAIAQAHGPALPEPLPTDVNEWLTGALGVGCGLIFVLTVLLTSWRVVDAIDFALCGCFKRVTPCFRHRQGGNAASWERAARVPSVTAEPRRSAKVAPA